MKEVKNPLQRVPVVDESFEALAPTNPGKAGRMLRRGKARVYRRFPFTIQIKKIINGINSRSH
jgi:hypothetical protein